MALHSGEPNGGSMLYTKQVTPSLKPNNPFQHLQTVGQNTQEMP